MKQETLDSFEEVFLYDKDEYQILGGKNTITLATKKSLPMRLSRMNGQYRHIIHQF